MQTRNPRRSMRAAGRPAAARPLYTVARAAAQDMANTPGRAVEAPSKPAQSAHWADAWFEATAEDLPAISASETLAAQLSQRGINNNSLTGTLPDHQPRYKVGDTPVLDISFLSQNPKVTILGKCEFANPTGSIKDRMVSYVLERAVAEGKLEPGGTIVAATSGNTGASVAMIAAMNGYDYKVITNAKCSEEKRNIMGAFGGEVIVGPSGVPADDPNHYQNMAISLSEEHGWYDLDQYGNQLNPEAYYYTLGPEIWKDTEGQVTHFVAGGSTGGTISGTGRYLKEQNPDVHIHCPDPHGSVFYDYQVNAVPEDQLAPGSYQVEGVGKDSIPPTMHFDVVDSMSQHDDIDCFMTCREIAKTTGVLIGGSSGLNAYAAAQLSGQIEEGVIVTVFPDSGFKYLSKVYNDDWLEAQTEKAKSR